MAVAGGGCKVSDEPIRYRSQELDIKDIELTLRIRRSLAEVIVVDIRNGSVSLSLEHEIVKEVPFKKKKKRREP